MMLDAMDVDVDSQLPDELGELVFDDDHGQSIEEIRLAEIERDLGEHEEPQWTGPDDGEELEFWRPPSPRHGAYSSIPILEETLKPLQDQERASDAETRLLQGLGSGSETSSSAMKDLQSKFDAVSAECLAEKEKNRKLTTENERLTRENEKVTMEMEKLTTENEKQQYRITHLIRAVKEAP